ncbi:MAG: peptidylprolyl isomerase, partial [Butyricicoccus sp.]|nr:peptidylprolyl isomerase [Butyricicoccus sp.]
TSEEMLAEVNNAITAIMVGGQSYKIGSRSLTRANLSELRALRDQLMAENARGADEGLIGGCFVAEFLPR